MLAFNNFLSINFFSRPVLNRVYANEILEILSNMRDN